MTAGEGVSAAVVSGWQPAETPHASRRRRRWELFRYVAVGLLNTAFAFAVFGLLEVAFGDHLPYLLVLALSHVVAVLEAFVVQRLIVFRVRGNVLVDLARFWSVYLGGFAINLLVLPVLVEVASLPVVPAQAAYLAFSAAVTYVLHKRFSFRR